MLRDWLRDIDLDDMASRIPADPSQRQRASAEAITQLEA